jgi:hypothetical protein
MKNYYLVIEQDKDGGVDLNSVRFEKKNWAEDYYNKLQHAELIECDKARIVLLKSK